MGYIKKHLSSEEKIIVFERLHWIVFFYPLFLITFLLSSALFIVNANWLSKIYSSVTAMPENIPNIGDIYESRIAYFLIAVAAFIIIKAAIKFSSTEAAVTTKRVIFKTGFIRINTLELRKEKIENIQVDQSIFGRILGYGDLTFIGTGGSPVIFKMIHEPIDTKKKINDQLFK